MSKYTLDVNGKRYELNEDFRKAIEELAENEYEENNRFSCWWKTEDGEPVMVIETVGRMVPWDRLDKQEASTKENNFTPEERRFGRMHFGVTPQRFEDVPDPGGDMPNRLPTKPERINDEMMVMWIPSHPEVDVTWSAGETMASVDTWVEWNIQERAEQPRPSSPSGYKQNSHDAFESLCKIHGCEVIDEAEPTNDIPERKETAGSVKRKGEAVYEEGKFGGNNWSV